MPWVPRDSVNRLVNISPSPIWQLGQRYCRIEQPDDVKAWRCYACNELVQLEVNKPGNATKHMRNKHGWKAPRQVDLSEGGSVREDSPTPSSSSRTTGPQQQTIFTMLQQGFEPSGADWRRNCLQWMIETHQPFSAVDDPTFRRMIEGITPKMKKYLFGRNAARDAAESEFEVAKDKIRDLIKESVTRIHISMDVWTAKFSKFGILGVVAHFATRHVYEVEIADKTEEKVDFKRRSVLLALRRLKEAHAGEYEAKILTDVVKEYEFTDNLGVCVADNAGENNTSVRALFRTLHPELKDPDGRRVRCLAHIINLAAKAYLFGNKKGNKDTAAEFVDAVQSLEVDDFDWESARALWRDQGPLGKLHNLIKFIRSSSQRKEEFRSIRTGDLSTDELMVLLDNQTRWNSQYFSISQALKVKERIIIFQSRYLDILKDDILIEDDWTRLQELKDGLWPFLLATNKIQGHQGSLWQWLPYLEGLYNKLEKEVSMYERGGEFSWLAAPSHAAWKKTQEYYEATDTAYHLYAAATLFNPEQRMQYFNRHWNTPALERHKKKLLPAIKKEWMQFYKPKDKELPQQPQIDNQPDFLDEQLGQVPISINSKDPLTEYAMGAPDKLQDSNTEAYFAWWDKHGHPHLKQMAWDSLAIPATSCDLERVFSSAGQLLDCTMNRMSDKTLETRECLRHWLKSGFIELRAI